MIGRVLALCGGLAGGAGLAQFPEYSQQYVQRLGGAVDALEQVVADFDSSARAEGLSREAALAAMTGSDFVERRGADMTRTIERAARLRADLTEVTGASAWARLTMAPRFADREIGAKALENFKPAVPLSFEGLGFAGAGFLGGWVVVASLWSLFTLPLRRARRLG